MAYSQDIADRVCERLREGGSSLRAICRDLGVSHSTVLEWANNNIEGFADQYTRARELATLCEFEDFQDLADTTPERGPDGKVDGGWVRWHQSRLDARKWAWAKRMPKKFGDKLELAGSKESPLTVVVRKLSDDK